MCDLMDYSPWNSQGQNTGVGSLSLTPGDLPNPGILHYRQILYQLSHKGSLRILEWVAYPSSRGSCQKKKHQQPATTKQLELVKKVHATLPNAALI